MAEMNGQEEAFPVLLRRVKSEPDEDLITDKSFDEVDSQFSQPFNSQDSETDLDYIITTEDGEPLYDFPSPEMPVISTKPSPKKRKRKSSESPRSAKRRQRCGLCGPCQVKTNCGECGNCLRRSVLKQSCIYRKCLYLRKAKTPLPSKEQPNEVPSDQPEPGELRETYVDETGLMPDDTAMLENPMVLLSPDSRGSPEQTICEPNECPPFDSQDPVDGVVTSEFNTSESAVLSSATASKLQTPDNVNSSHLSESGDPIDSSPTEKSKGGNLSPSHGAGGSDSEDKGVQSKDFFMNTILHDSEEQLHPDSEERLHLDSGERLHRDSEEPLHQGLSSETTQHRPGLGRESQEQRPVPQPNNNLHRPFLYPNLPFQRFPMGPNMSLQRPLYDPGIKFEQAENFNIQREILRRKILERSMSQDNSQVPNVVDWKKDFETGGKILPSWKAFGSYDRTEERHVVKGLLENVSRRKSNKPKRLSTFVSDSEQESDVNAKKRRRSHSPSNQQEWTYAPPNRVVPQPQFPGAENHRFPHPMFDKVPPWQRSQDYIMNPRDFEPRAFYPHPPPQPSYYMGRFSQYPNKPDVPRHHTSRGLVPKVPNCNGKLTPHRPEKYDSVSEEGSQRRMYPFQGENTPPFSQEKCNIRQGDLQGPQGALFQNPFNNVAKDMHFTDYVPIPDQHISPGIDFSYQPNSYHFPNPHIMTCPDNRFPISPYQGPRIFSPWMPHGIPMNRTGPFLGPYPPFQPRIPNCVPERPATRPPPPLRIPNFRPRSQTSNGSSGQTPTMPELERRAGSPKESSNSRKDLTCNVNGEKRPPMDEHLKRYLDDVYQNQKCFPARPASEPSKPNENQKLDSSVCRFEQEMISIDDFHVSAYIRADGANSVEIEFDQSSIIGDHSSIGDPHMDSQSSSESSPMSRRRRFSEPCLSNQPSVSGNAGSVSTQMIINGCPFRIGLKGSVRGNINLQQDLGDEVMVQLEIPGDKFIVENILLESELTTSSSNVQELLQFVKSELH